MVPLLLPLKKVKKIQKQDYKFSLNNNYCNITWKPNIQLGQKEEDFEDCQDSEEESKEGDME